MRVLHPAALFRHSRKLIGSGSRRFVTAAGPVESKSSSPSDIALGKAEVTIAAGKEPSPRPGRKPKQVGYRGHEHVAQGSPTTRRETMSTLEVVPPADLHLSWNRLKLKSPTFREAVFPYFVLRDLCKCPQCVDPYSKQRSFRTSDIPGTIYPRRVRWDGKHLKIQWANDIPGYSSDHVSAWSADYLKMPYLDTHDEKRWCNRSLNWTGPLMDKLQHWVSYEDYMKDDGKFAVAMRHLSRLGLIFVKNIPHSREEVEKIATRMGPLRNTFYGQTWDVRTIPEAKNVAYTNQFLGFHMDLMYMNEPPGYQLLHCLENSCVGGESLFSDSLHAAIRMRRSYPNEFETLTQRHLAYEYVQEDQVYFNSRPVIELDEQGYIEYVNYSPPFQSKLRPNKRSSLRGVAEFRQFTRALRRFVSLMEHESAVFQLKLNPGECAIFANRRIVHARREFDTSNGSRWLAGAYVDEDAVLSRFAVTERQHARLWKKADPVRVMGLMHARIDRQRGTRLARKTGTFSQPKGKT